MSLSQKLSVALAALMTVKRGINTFEKKIRKDSMTSFIFDTVKTQIDHMDDLLNGMMQECRENADLSDRLASVTADRDEYHRLYEELRVEKMAPTLAAMPPLNKDECLFINQGNPIEAIKMYRRRVGCALKEAKDKVEEYRYGSVEHRSALEKMWNDPLTKIG